MKLLNVVGARPQFIKVGPIQRAIDRHNVDHPDRSIDEILVHTGQHYDQGMSQVFFDELELKKPDHNLGVGSGSHGHQTGQMLARIEDVLVDERPDVVMVYGDTNSTLSGALAAVKLHIPVAHVEAGLRSFNRQMPEEVNRVLTDHASDWLFCPTERAVQNLEREGITEGVHFVGDVMYDSVLYNGQLAEAKSEILDKLNLAPKGYALATVHRAENTDDPERLRSIMEALDRIAQDQMPVIFPLHPRTRAALRRDGLDVDHVTMIDPVGYLDMLQLEKHATVILTDSGGVQKEAFFSEVPCVTLRDETEWVETVEAGWNSIVGCDGHKMVQAISEVFRQKTSVCPYGTGEAAETILNILVTSK